MCNNRTRGVELRPSGARFLHRWHTHSLVSIYYLIRMGKMYNALVSISSIYCVGFTNNVPQSSAGLYITVCINRGGPEIRARNFCK